MKATKSEMSKKQYSKEEVEQLAKAFSEYEKAVAALPRSDGTCNFFVRDLTVADAYELAGFKVRELSDLQYDIGVEIVSDSVLKEQDEMCRYIENEVRIRVRDKLRRSH